MNGDFSRLDPLFVTPAGGKSAIVQWHEEGAFDAHPDALAEAFTCACFNGRDEVVDYLIARGAHPDGGQLTGMTAFHWAANRGQLATVRRLIGAGASLEAINNYGGTVLGQTVWSVFHEPRPDLVEIIEELLDAGAQVEAGGYPTGDARIDELLLKHGAK